MTEPFTRNATLMGASAILSAVAVAASDTSNRRPTLTPCQAAAELAVSDRTVHRWIRHGDLPAVRVGGRYRITREAVESMVRPAHKGGDA